MTDGRRKNADDFLNNYDWNILVTNPLHLPMLRPTFRKYTNEIDGCIPINIALNRFEIDGSFAFLGKGYLHLGQERPIYEVSFRNKIYRMLFRPVPGKNRSEYQFIRCVSEGLESDGILLDSPLVVPNSPFALLKELVQVTCATKGGLLKEAFDISRYRVQNTAGYPSSFGPEGYQLARSLLFVESSEGTFQTLYQTPRLVNPDMWTLFLTALDKETYQPLINYVFSSMCHRELATAGRDAAILALKTRMNKQMFPKPSSVSLTQLVSNFEIVLRNGRSVGLERFDNGF